MIGGPLDRSRSGIGHVGVVAQTAQDTDRQVASQLDLTRQAHVRWTVLDALQAFLFGGRHGAGVTVDDFDPTCRAARVAPAPVENVDSGVLDAEHEPPPLLAGRLADPLDRNTWHVESSPFLTRAHRPRLDCLRVVRWP